MLNWKSWISATIPLPISHSNRTTRKEEYLNGDAKVNLFQFGRCRMCYSSVINLLRPLLHFSWWTLWSSFSEHNIIRWAFHVDWAVSFTKLQTVRSQSPSAHNDSTENYATFLPAKAEVCWPLSPIDLSQSGRNQLLQFQHFNIDILYVFRLIKFLVSIWCCILGQQLPFHAHCSISLRCVPSIDKEQKAIELFNAVCSILRHPPEACRYGVLRACIGSDIVFGPKIASTLYAMPVNGVQARIWKLNKYLSLLFDAQQADTSWFIFEHNGNPSCSSVCHISEVDFNWIVV